VRSSGVNQAESFCALKATATITWSNTCRLLRTMSTWPFVIGSKDPGYTAIRFIRRPPSLLLLHLGPATADRPRPTLRHDHLCAALRADVDLPDLIRHVVSSSYRPRNRAPRRVRKAVVPSRRSAVVRNRTDRARSHLMPS